MENAVCKMLNFCFKQEAGRVLTRQLGDEISEKIANRLVGVVTQALDKDYGLTPGTDSCGERKTPSCRPGVCSLMDPPLPTLPHVVSSLGTELLGKRPRRAPPEAKSRHCHGHDTIVGRDYIPLAVPGYTKHYSKQHCFSSQYLPTANTTMSTTAFPAKFISA